MTGRVAPEGMPNVMLSSGGMLVPVAAGIIVTPVPAAVCVVVVTWRLCAISTCRGFRARTLVTPSKAKRAVKYWVLMLESGKKSEGARLRGRR